MTFYHLSHWSLVWIEWSVCCKRDFCRELWMMWQLLQGILTAVGVIAGNSEGCESDFSRELCLFETHVDKVIVLVYGWKRKGCVIKLAIAPVPGVVFAQGGGGGGGLDGSDSRPECMPMRGNAFVCVALQRQGRYSDLYRYQSLI